MHPTTSIFLDLLRYSAAIVVFLSHVTSKEFNSAVPWVSWGHQAVIVFFVISGFVIAYVIAEREQSVAKYAAARFGRLYSVIIPALIFTAIVDSLGRGVNPDVYAEISNDYPLTRLLANLLFIQQNWNFTIMPLSNGPFWSLGFEFWYYCIFGACVLTSGWRRIVLTLFFAVLAGPRIVAFFPVWLLGVLAYKISSMQNLTPKLLRLIFLCSLATLCMVVIYGNPLNTVTESIKLAYASRYYEALSLQIFLGDIPRLPQDFLLGVLIALLLISVRGFSVTRLVNSKLAATIRYLAGTTFTLYLFHVPMLYFCYAFFTPDKNSMVETSAIAVAILLLCIPLSYIGERQGYTYRKIFLSIFNAITNKRRTAQAIAEKT